MERPTHHVSALLLRDGLRQMLGFSKFAHDPFHPDIVRVTFVEGQCILSVECQDCNASVTLKARSEGGVSGILPIQHLLNWIKELRCYESVSFAFDEEGNVSVSFDRLVLQSTVTFLKVRKPFPRESIVLEKPEDTMEVDTSLFVSTLRALDRAHSRVSYSVRANRFYGQADNNLLTLWATDTAQMIARGIPVTHHESVRWSIHEAHVPLIIRALRVGYPDERLTIATTAQHLIITCGGLHMRFLMDDARSWDAYDRLKVMKSATEVFVDPVDLQQAVARAAVVVRHRRVAHRDSSMTMTFIHTQDGLLITTKTDTASSRELLPWSASTKKFFPMHIDPRRLLQGLKSYAGEPYRLCLGECTRPIHIIGTYHFLLQPIVSTSAGGEE